VHNAKPGVVIRDMARYYRVDPELRAKKQSEWNRPVWWPMVVLLMALAALAWLGRRSHAQREMATARVEVKS
jgi:hypothetical protein